MKFLRILKKSSFHLQKILIGIFVYLNHRLYMRLLNGLLRRHGFRLLGTPRFIAKSARFDDFEKVTLGDRVVISMNVHFLTHDYSLTTALVATGEVPKTDKAVVRPIIVGDNVFIGMNTILLPGTTVGSNVIIGAGSVVRGRIEDDSIVAGNPAVVIGNIHSHAEKALNRSDVIIREDTV